ncbi:hypothetical protein [Flavivirga algicola]|uniref:DUF2116 family Zn-ribbon domain-containing protein n=1 Tax=Flavivirga algicola TaxID=2729136 RepID=A0ABX1S5R7_9FLAO|nr:hypothetical protein [Flavivirga algicola]NMH89779.1 hypothetical protein [Flavivirga algicola]
MNICPHCTSEIIGRSDKKYCSVHCKSAHQYKKRKEEEGLYYSIDKQLKTNRKLLKAYNKSGLSTVCKEKLLLGGFDPRYFTHYWKNKKGQVYLFCYEYGFLELKKENQKEKYLLVTWQGYMER